MHAVFCVDFSTRIIISIDEIEAQPKFQLHLNPNNFQHFIRQVFMYSNH